MEVLEQSTVVFTLALALALVIERAVEIAKAAYDLFDSRGDWYRYWTRRAETLRERLESRLNALGWIDRKSAARILNRFNEMLLDEADGHDGTVPVLSGDLVRRVHVRLGAKALGIGLGIVAAWLIRLDLLAWAGAAPDRSLLPSPSTPGIIVTGVLLGLGSGIVHKAITEIEKKRQRKAEEGA